MKRNLLLIIALFVCVLSFGQGEIDAYRYSNDDLSGTARGQAMGGAFGALGGDVTGVAINPAGIGIYRSSEILANMSLTAPIISGNTNQQSNTAFHFDNLSYMSYYPLIKGSMLSLNFGFNYNRIKSFDQKYSTSKSSMSSSLTDNMALLTNGISSSTLLSTSTYNPYNNPHNPWLSVLGYDGCLFIPANNTNNQYQSILNDGEKVSPSLKVSEKGKVESYDFTIGANISNKFYWGATVSIINLSYIMNSSYDESFGEGGGFNLDNYLETKGSGYQAKLGVIFKPVDALRLGVSYHSPVWYSMTDYYKGWIDPRGIYIDDQLAGEVSTPGGDSQNSNSPAYTDYHFRTPGSWTFSAAAVLGTKAIVSVDYEIKNYASMNLKDTNGNEWTDVNDFMNSDYRNASTIRAGFEYRFNPQLSGRVGYAWAQSPYQSEVNAFGDNNFDVVGDVAVTAGTVPHYTLSGNTNYLTAGIGFKFTPQFYCDFALVLRTEKDDVYYFTPKAFQNQTEKVNDYYYRPQQDQNHLQIFDSFAGAFTNKTLKGLLTFGYKF